MSALVEPLEARRLMSATIIGQKNIVITADDTATTVDIRVINASTFSITIDDGPAARYSYKRVRSIRFYGGDGDDTVRVISRAAIPIFGVPKNVAFSRRVILVGGGGDDYLADGYGAGRINGGPGNDTLIGGGGSDIIVGGAGDDVIEGGPLASEFSLTDGNDVIFGGSGNDTIDGANGTDVLFGQDGDDSLLGGTGRDALYGNGGNDTLDGGIGRNILYAGGDAGDVINTTPGARNLSRYGDLKGMSHYLSRMIRAYVTPIMRVDANS
jgi:Ca2+-binding RTX toxin-like protein